MQARRYCGERRALGSLILVLAISGAPLTVLAQNKPWTPPRTPEGQPDLQGVWSNASIVALERPTELEGKQFFTPGEKAAYEAKVFARSSRDKPPAAGGVGTYNDFWWDADSKRAPNFRTSLIVDPPDGRIPPLTPQAQRRIQQPQKSND